MMQNCSAFSRGLAKFARWHIRSRAVQAMRNARVSKTRQSRIRLSRPPGRPFGGVEHATGRAWFKPPPMSRAPTAHRAVATTGASNSRATQDRRRSSRSNKNWRFKFWPRNDTSRRSSKKRPASSVANRILLSTKALLTTKLCDGVKRPAPKALKSIAQPTGLARRGRATGLKARDRAWRSTCGPSALSLWADFPGRCPGLATSAPLARRNAPSERLSPGWERNRGSIPRLQQRFSQHLHERWFHGKIAPRLRPGRRSAPSAPNPVTAPAEQVASPLGASSPSRTGCDQA